MLTPVVGGCLNCSTELIPMSHTCKPDGDQLCSYLFSKIPFFTNDHPTVTYVLCYFLSGHNVCTRLHEGHNVCTHTHISMMYMKFTHITSFMNMVNTIVIIMIVVVHSMLWTTTAFMQLLSHDENAVRDVYTVITVTVVSCFVCASHDVHCIRNRHCPLVCTRRTC